jgi:hypothetical protein
VATLVYNGVTIHLSNTLSCDFEPVMDPSGVDYLYSKVTLEVMGVVSDAATVSPGLPNPDLAHSLQALRQKLNSPRQDLTYSVNDFTVFDVPGTGVNGPLRCCPMNGPHVRARVSKISGDKSAIIVFKAVFGVTDCSKVVLSHRWTMTGDTDQLGFTTRTTRGTMIVRPDLLLDNNLNMTQFRRAIFQPLPTTFKREQISVTPSADDTRLDYVLVDREWPLGFANNNAGIMKVDGYATAGWDFNKLKNAADGIGVAIDPNKWLGALIPIVTASCIVQLWGNRNSSKELLARKAVSIAVDRLKNRLVAGAHITQHLIEPYIEFRMQSYISFENIQQAFGQGANINNAFAVLDGLMNLSPALTVEGDRWDIFQQPPQMQNGNSTGSFLGDLVTQIFTADDCSLPEDPPAQKTSAVKELQ